MNPVITAWSAYSPFGAGRAAFAAGVAAGRTAVAPIDRAHWDTLDDRAGLVPDFDPRAVLGRKGTRGMNRVSGLAVATVRRLQEEVGADAGTALVLGTTTGSAETMMDTIRSALRAARPYLTDPVTTPYGVMNGAAGQCAIWHGFKGPNATIAAGRPTGLAALGYARRLLRTGRADTVFFGAAEEYSRARSWMEFHARADAPDAPLGEGCAMFTLVAEPPAGLPVLADVLAVETGVCLDGDWGTAVERTARRALAAAGPSPGPVWATCASGAPGAEGAAEAAVLASVAAADTALPSVTRLLGETHAAASAFQLAAVLTAAAAAPEAAGRTALLSAIDPSGGTVAAAVLRLGGAR